MRHTSARVLVLALAFVGVACALTAAGCGEPPPQGWQRLTSGQLSAAQSSLLDLGTYSAAGDLRLAWTLTGPSDARATFEFAAARVNAASNGMLRNASTVRSWSQSFAPRSEQALMLGSLEPAEWQVTLRQRVAQGGRGFSGSYTLYMSKSP